MATKYSPNDTEENRQQVIAREWKPLCMFVLEIEHMTGKEAIELSGKVMQPAEFVQTIEVVSAVAVTKMKVYFVRIEIYCNEKQSR